MDLGEQQAEVFALCQLESLQEYLQGWEKLPQAASATPTMYSDSHSNSGFLVSRAADNAVR